MRATKERARFVVPAGYRRVLPGVAADLTVEQWIAICARWRFRCAYCGRRPFEAGNDPLCLEHVEPLSRGGGHTVDNVVPSCVGCNVRKHDLLLLEWACVRVGLWGEIGKGRTRRGLRVA